MADTNVKQERLAGTEKKRRVIRLVLNGKITINGLSNSEFVLRADKEDVFTNAAAVDEMIEIDRGVRVLNRKSSGQIDPETGKFGLVPEDFTIYAASIRYTIHETT